MNDSEKQDKPYIIMEGTPDAMLVLPKDKYSIKIGQISTIEAVAEKEKVDLKSVDGNITRNCYDNKDYSNGFRTYINYSSSLTLSQCLETCVTEYDEIIKVLTEYGNPTKLVQEEETKHEEKAEHKYAVLVFDIGVGGENSDTNEKKELHTDYIYDTKEEAIRAGDEFITNNISVDISGLYSSREHKLCVCSKMLDGDVVYTKIYK